MTTLSHCSYTTTPLMRSTQAWTYFKMLSFPFGIRGKVDTAKPTPPPGITCYNRCRLLQLSSQLCLGRKCHDLLFSSDASCDNGHSVDSDSVADRQQLRHHNLGRYMLHAYCTDTALPASRHPISRGEDSASPSRGPVLPPTPQPPPPPPSPIYVNRLLKTDPLVLAVVLRCRWNEIKMATLTGMLQTTSSTHEQRYLLKIRPPAVPDYSTKLPLNIHIPSHRTLSPSRYVMAVPTALVPERACFQLTRERDGTHRRTSVDRTDSCSWTRGTAQS